MLPFGPLAIEVLLERAAAVSRLALRCIIHDELGDTDAGGRFKEAPTVDR